MNAEHLKIVFLVLASLWILIHVSDLFINWFLSYDNGDTTYPAYLEADERDIGEWVAGKDLKPNDMIQAWDEIWIVTDKVSRSTLLGWRVPDKWRFVDIVNKETGEGHSIGLESGVYRLK